MATRVDLNLFCLHS